MPQPKVTIGTLTAFAGQLTLIGGTGAVYTLNGPQNPFSWTLQGTDAGSGGPASSTPVIWSPPSGAGGASLLGVSCTTTGVCVAGGPNGELASSSNAGATWAVAPIDGTYTIESVSCTPTFCVAVDNHGEVLTSTDPTGNSVGDWVVTRIDPGQTLYGVSCSPDGGVCVAVDSDGNVFTATTPLGGFMSWTQASVDGLNTLSGISCPTDSLCVATDLLGDVIASAAPTGGASAWQVSEVDLNAPLTAISCTINSLCVATDAKGAVVTSEDPTAGQVGWTYTAVDGTNLITAISCTGAICVATDGAGNAITSNGPPDAPWVVTQIDKDGTPGGVSVRDAIPVRRGRLRRPGGDRQRAARGRVHRLDRVRRLPDAQRQRLGQPRRLVLGLDHVDDHRSDHRLGLGRRRGHGPGLRRPVAVR